MNKDMKTKILIMKFKGKKHEKRNLVVNLLELIQPEKILIFLFRLVKYKITLLNQLKN